MIVSNLSTAWQTYLGSGVVPGVGPGLAARLLGRFGQDLGTVIETAPERMTEVAGLRPATAMALAAWWRKERGRAGIILELLCLGAPLWVARRAVATWGASAVERVRADAYRLTELAGVGFATADAVARAQGVAADDPRRWRAALDAALDQAVSEGHCCLPRHVWARRAEDLLGTAGAVSELPLPASDRWVFDGAFVYPSDLHRAERNIEARWTLLLQAGSSSGDVPGEIDAGPAAVRLTAAQMQAVRLALREPISVLTGLPGTGKTTAVRAAVDAARRRGERVLLLAPTGKAAKRLAEVTACEASTIHRALGWRPGKAGPRFARNPQSPFEADFIVVDEASMLDVRLAQHLLRATAPGARLWLVGDAAQLPPVGPGRVFADAIDHGAVPVTALRTIQRQAESSPIVRLAHAVHDGYWPAVADWGNPGCRWIAAEASSAPAAAARLAAEARRAGEELQVLTAMRKGPDGVEALNHAIRDAVNPGTDGWRGFRPGDRVVATKNNADMDVVNGEQGVVREASVSARRLVVEFDGRMVVYPSSAARELELAYAMTVHKAQGSEWPSVAVVLTRRQYVMLRRELLYTALTRAKQRLILIGEDWAYRVAAGNAREQKRWSALFRKPAA